VLSVLHLAATEEAALTAVAYPESHCTVRSTSSESLFSNPAQFSRPYPVPTVKAAALKFDLSLSSYLPPLALPLYLFSQNEKPKTLNYKIKLSHMKKALLGNYAKPTRNYLFPQN